MRGFFEIGVYQPKTVQNVGTLWRSASQLGCCGLFVIGKKYKKQCSDCLHTTKHIPLREFLTFDDFLKAIPINTKLVAIEVGGKALSTYEHPERAIYILGAEDNGLPNTIQTRCHDIVGIESWTLKPYNVAVAGSIVMYHRSILRGLYKIKYNNGGLK